MATILDPTALAAQEILMRPRRGGAPVPLLGSGLMRDYVGGYEPIYYGLAPSTLFAQQQPVQRLYEGGEGGSFDMPSAPTAELSAEDRAYTAGALLGSPITSLLNLIPGVPFVTQSLSSGMQNYGLDQQVAALQGAQDTIGSGGGVSSAVIDALGLASGMGTTPDYQVPAGLFGTNFLAPSPLAPVVMANDYSNLAAPSIVAAPVVGGPMSTSVPQATPLAPLAPTVTVGGPMSTSVPQATPLAPLVPSAPTRSLSGGGDGGFSVDTSGIDATQANMGDPEGAQAVAAAQAVADAVASVEGAGIAAASGAADGGVGSVGDVGISGGSDSIGGVSLGGTDTSGGFDGGGGGGGGGGKIICTAMNHAYGFGSFRNAIWIAYADKHLTKAHEVGYHALFLPLVDFGFKRGDGKLNLLVRKVLEWGTRHRSTDLRAEMRGTKRDNTGRIIRWIFEPLCYAVGKLKGY